MTQTFLALAIWSLTLTVILWIAYGRQAQGMTVFTGVSFVIFLCIWLLTRTSFRYTLSPDADSVSRDICPIDYFVPDMQTDIRARLTGKNGLRHVYPTDAMSIRAAVLRRKMVRQTKLTIA